MWQDISWKTERKNPWFKPWYNILLHTQSIVHISKILTFVYSWRCYIIYPIKNIRIVDSDKNTGKATSVAAGYGSMYHTQLLVFDAIKEKSWSSGISSAGSIICAKIASTEYRPTIELGWKGIKDFPVISVFLSDVILGVAYGNGFDGKVNGS